MPFRLFRCLAKALAKNGVKFVCGFVPGGETLYEIAAEVWEDYRREAGVDALRQEVQDLAKAPPDQVNSDAEQAVRATGARLSPDEQRALVTYLGQVPASIRRSLRRPADPTGTTMPASLCLDRPDGLLQLLPARPPRFRPGDRPPGVADYVLEELIGVGGFGEVWKARHIHLRSQPPVALKFCLDEGKDARFLENEVRMLDRVLKRGKHPGIVPLLQTYLSAQPPCLAYEYVAGGDLTGLIREVHEQKRMTPKLAGKFLLHLAEIVGHVHDSIVPIVHSDLKPANVLVKKLARGYQLRVTDFGIGGLAASQAARETRRPTRSRQQLLTEAVRGAYTPLYAPPQQITRRRGDRADTRDDVYALGVIWYQLVTGDLGMTSIPSEWRERLLERGMRKEQVELLGSCIAASAERRPADARILAVRLKALLHPVRKPVSWLLPVAALALLVGVVIGIFALRTRIHKDDLNQQALEETLSDTPRQKETDSSRTVPKSDTRKATPSSPTLPKAEARRENPSPLREDDRPDKARKEDPVIKAALPQEPPPLDCSGPNGVSPEEVRKSQEAWAKALGRPVEEEVEVGNGVKMTFILIPPGRFRMGSPETEEDRRTDEVLHLVRLTKPFYLGKYSVTQAQYKTLTGDTPSHFKGQDLPVEQVSWDDSRTYGEKLTARRNDGCLYRLPTEAEWEYASRGGRPSSKPFGIGDGTSLDSTQANFDSNFPYNSTTKGISRQQTTPVGAFKPNAFGLFDMHGNVWQWCSDWHDDYPAEADDPAGPPQGSNRVIRGGSWYSDGRRCRAAYRFSYSPAFRDNNIGFRLARSVPSISK